MTPLVAAILAYLVLQFAIGAWVSRLVRTEDDYLVGGRRLGYPLAIFSIFATWFGAETCGDFSLVGCTVSPGFDFADFELANRTGLTELFPQHRALITRLTRG